MNRVAQLRARITSWQLWGSGPKGPGRRRTLRRAAILVSAGLIVTAVSAAPASAQVLDTWSRSTTGAAGSGSIDVTNGYLRNVLAISDIKADGDCAYVETTWDHHDSILHAWFKVSSERKTVCGNGTTLLATVQRSLDSLSSLFSDAVRVKVKVCRNVNNAPDNCSGTYQSPSYPV